MQLVYWRGDSRTHLTQGVRRWAREGKASSTRCIIRQATSRATCGSFPVGNSGSQWRACASDLSCLRSEGAGVFLQSLLPGACYFWFTSHRVGSVVRESPQTKHDRCWQLEVRLASREISADVNLGLRLPGLCASSTLLAVPKPLKNLWFAPCQMSHISPFSLAPHSLSFPFFFFLSSFCGGRIKPVPWSSRDLYCLFSGWALSLPILNCEWASILLNLVPPTLHPMDIPYDFGLLRTPILAF